MDIALVSLNQVWEDKAANIEQCDICAKKASENGVDLIIFPEMTLTGFSMNTELIGEQENDSFTVKVFQKIANKYSISIVLISLSSICAVLALLSIFFYNRIEAKWLNESFD